MRVELAKPENSAGVFVEAVYRVLLWNAPSKPNHAWFLDEWDVFEARDALEVIEWAESQNATAYEVAVIWPNYEGHDGDGNQVMQLGFTLIAGDRGDFLETATIVPFVLDEPASDHT